MPSITTENNPARLVMREYRFFHARCVQTVGNLNVRRTLKAHEGIKVVCMMLEMFGQQKLGRLNSVLS